jgi:hypothetical protein
MIATDETVYNVECMACGSVFTPTVQSTLWWKAKKRAERYLDALHVTGEECGCVKKRRDPDAPFRVFGYDGFCQDFDIPFGTFTAAVKKFAELTRSGEFVVFIDGISEAVRRKIEFC